MKNTKIQNNKKIKINKTTIRNPKVTLQCMVCVVLKSMFSIVLR